MAAGPAFQAVSTTGARPTRGSHQARWPAYHSTVARMPASVFRETVHAHPDVCDQLLALLAGQIRMLANRVNEFTTLDALSEISAMRTLHRVGTKIMMTVAVCASVFLLTAGDRLNRVASACT